ncbi:MAG TPA: SMI1/KNR4 family protein [Pyrinomonadaceae bacterium]|nr:SMI1/KNR4 family protein [Pyrinomonadaceae bacterium]
MNVHEVVDGFARVVSSAGIPVVPLDNVPRIEQFESRLPARLPASFRSLVTRYSFPAFAVNSLSLFANNDVEVEQELSHAVFQDKVIADVTLRAGYIQFARPADGRYDPVCFDTNERSKNREFPIVTLDHEAILINSRIVVREVIGKSFFKFVQTIIALEKDQQGIIISVIK